MLRRIISVFAIVVLMAPAIAVCAGAAEPSQKSGNHDCCLEETAAEGASPAPSPPAMTESCCRLSDDAGRRVAVPAPKIVTALPILAAVPAWIRALPTAPPSANVFIAPLSSEHVPRHLLLSVLIV